MSLAQKTVDSLYQAMTLFIRDNETRFHPSAVIISSFLLVGYTVYTDNPLMLICILVFMLSLGLLTLKSRRFLILLLWGFIFTLIVSLPVVFSYVPPKNSGATLKLYWYMGYISIPGFVMLILRTLAALVIMELAIGYLGYRNFVDGLYRLRIPERIILILHFFVVFFFRLISRTRDRLLGRYSRLIKKGLKREWYLLASVVGDLFIGSIRDSKKLSLGLSSRGFNWNYCFGRQYKWKLQDILLVILTVMFIVVVIMFAP